MYRGIRNYIATPVVGLALLAAQGCKKGEPKMVPISISNSEAIQYLGNIPESGSIEALATADMDGDGDMDIVTVSSGGKLYIVFNNLPQRNMKLKAEKESH